MLVFTTIFGVLWGIVETLLGSYLHMFDPPFRGAVMAGIGAIILCTERLYTPSFGATLSTGVVAVAMKCLSVGAIRLPPAIAIGVESLMAELILTALGTGRIAFLLACIACCMEGIPHVIIAHRIIYGEGIFAAYLKVVEKFQASLGMGDNLWREVLLLWVAGHAAIGVVAGLGAISIGSYLRRE